MACYVHVRLAAAVNLKLRKRPVCFPKRAMAPKMEA